MKKILFPILMALSAAAVAQPVGLQLYSINKELRADLHGTLSQVASWGITDVEISEYYGLSAEGLHAALESHGLRVLSVPADFGLLESDPMAVVRAAKEMGAAYAVCYWTPHPPGQFAQEHIAAAARVLGAAGKILSDNGIQLCYHPHWYEFGVLGSGTFFDFLAANTDARYLQFELDVFWIQFAGYDPAKVLGRYKYRTPIVHLKDRQRGAAVCQPADAPAQNAALGQGMIDIGGIVRAARSNATVKYLVIEDESAQALGNIPIGIRFVAAE